MKAARARALNAVVKMLFRPFFFFCCNWFCLQLRCRAGKLLKSRLTCRWSAGKSIEMHMSPVFWVRQLL